jgi:hypothetical protein
MEHSHKPGKGKNCDECKKREHEEKWSTERFKTFTSRYDELIAIKNVETIKEYDEVIKKLEPLNDVEQIIIYLQIQCKTNEAIMSTATPKYLELLKHSHRSTSGALLRYIDGTNK